MKRIPDLLFIIDVNREETAVHEANLKNVPIIAMVDTNCDPRNIDYVIPSNDDAIRAIKLMVSKIADAVIEGKSLRKDEEFDDEDLAPGEERPQVVRHKMEEDAELDDETLLGASTLAKLDVEKEETEETEETEEEVETVKTVETVEQVSEEDLEKVAEEEFIAKDEEEVEEEVVAKKPKAKKATKAKTTKKATKVEEEVDEKSSDESEEE